MINSGLSFLKYNFHNQMFPKLFINKIIILEYKVVSLIDFFTGKQNLIKLLCFQLNFMLIIFIFLVSFIDFNLLKYNQLMQYHPDHPTINQVQSFIISNKAPTKLLTSTKCLAQSKHTVDSITSSYKMPSDQCLQKIAKIFPHKVRSTGSDSNSNIRCVISVVLQIVYDSFDEQLEKIFAQKIQSQKENKNYFVQLRNHNHESVTYENIVKVITGFLKTIKNKKIKSPQQFDLTQEIQNLPIIIQYLVLIARTILYRFKIQNSIDFSQQIKDKDCFNVLTDYFDLNYLRKDSYYFFQEYSYFIYKNQKEYIFGKHGEKQNNKTKSFQDKKNQIQPLMNKYEAYCNLKILQCSMESGSNLLSSRHADQSTPCFNNMIQGQNIFFKAHFKKQVAQSQKKSSQSMNHNSKSNQNRTFDSRGVQSKSSGFQVNVISQANLKSFNNKYRTNHNNAQSLRQEFADISQKNSPNKINIQQNNPKVNSKNNNSKSQFGAANFKKGRLQKQTSPNKGNFTQLKKARSNQCIQQILKFNSQNNFQCQNHKIKENQKFDKIFEWGDSERRLRRVQTICYKTCSTCHRRFYLNQIRSNIIDIKIDNKRYQKRSQQDLNKVQKLNQNAHKNSSKANQNKVKKYQSSQEYLYTNSTKFESKSHQQFLNKKFHKKSADAVIELQEPKTQGSVNNVKDQKKGNVSSLSNNLNWMKNININLESKQRSITTVYISPTLSPKNMQVQKDLLHGNGSIKITNNFKNVLGTINSTKTSQIPTKDIKQPIKVEMQEKIIKIQDQKGQISQKSKTFLSFKSQKQFKRIKPVGNVDFRKNVQKHKSPFMNKNVKNKVQNFKFQGALSGQLGPVSIKQFPKSTNIIQMSKSAQKKFPYFIRKESQKQQQKIKQIEN